VLAVVLVLVLILSPVLVLVLVLVLVPVLVLAIAGASSSSSTSANTSTSASTSASPSTSTSISIGASTMLCRTNIQVVLAHVLHATLRMSCTQPCASVEYFRVSICRSTLSSLRLRYFRKMLQSA
jgi:hypothetical protein